MGHVGEEFGLVPARTLQLLGALFEQHLHLLELAVLAVQGIALLGQGFGALGQLLIGLFKLGLLGLQMGLGLLEHPRLLFELLVGGLELLLLHLQFFVELLGFGQHFLQALAVTRRFDGGADIAGEQLQQFNVAVGQGT
ncbi:hypothetical protein D3C80_1480140 [compost metagenome]